MTQEPDEDAFTYCANKIYGCILHIFDGCKRCDDILNLYNCNECNEGYYKVKDYHYCNQIEDDYYNLTDII